MSAGVGDGEHSFETTSERRMRLALSNIICICKRQCPTDSYGNFATLGVIEKQATEGLGSSTHSFGQKQA